MVVGGGLKGSREVCAGGGCEWHDDLRACWVEIYRLWRRVTRKRSTILAGAIQVCGKVCQGSVGHGAPCLRVGGFQMTREASRSMKKRTVQCQSKRFLDPHRAPELLGTFDPPQASSTMVFLGGECPISRFDRGSVLVGETCARGRAGRTPGSGARRRAHARAGSSPALPS